MSEAIERNNDLIQTNNLLIAACLILLVILVAIVGITVISAYRDAGRRKHRSNDDPEESE